MGSSLAYAAANSPDYIDVAPRGPAAFFDLGLICASGSGGTVVDLVEAHKWFNLAALSGMVEAQAARAEVAAEMSREEIVVAQKAARAFLAEARLAA